MCFSYHLIKYTTNTHELMKTQLTKLFQVKSGFIQKIPGLAAKLSVKGPSLLTLYFRDTAKSCRIQASLSHDLLVIFPLSVFPLLCLYTEHHIHTETQTDTLFSFQRLPSFPESNSSVSCSLHSGILSSLCSFHYTLTHCLSCLSLQRSAFVFVCK